MIYTASLSLAVKKAYTKDCMQSSVAKILSQLNDDPKISTMDTVVLGPRDFVGPKGKKLASSIPNAHPGIFFIYIYNKDVEEDLVDCANKKQVKKVTANSVREIVDSFLSDHIILSGQAKVSSADFKVPTGDDIDFELPPEEEEDAPIYVPPSEPMFTVPIEEQDKQEDSTVPDQFQIPEPTFNFEDSDLGDQFQPSSIPAPVLPEEPLGSGTGFKTVAPASVPTMSIEEAIDNVRSTDDWELFKQSLHRDSIIKKLIEENSQFQGLINIIDTLDYKIQGIWQDVSLSAEAKFDKIKEVGLDRAVAVATANSIMADKVIGIISKITLAAKRTVEDKLESYDKAMYTVASNKMQITDASQIEHAMNERAKVQFELLALSRKIIDLYTTMDLLVTQEIDELDAKLPSSNEFINNMIRPIGTQMFTPKNTAELANNMLKALENNRIVHSQLENHVNAMVEMMFELFQKDSDVINYQQNLIAMLRASHVEDVVIVDSVIKNMLRIYTGADSTGRSSTAITWCGILSRRQNCLLIDLTGKSKFREYGITPMSLDDFMKDRVQKQFLCVESTGVLNPDYLQSVMEELKTRLDYYPYINLIMDPDDIDSIEQVSSDALTIHYICNCTKESMEKMKETIHSHTYKNIARKLVLIDPPISPLSIMDALEVDPTLFRLVILPNMPDIRACAIQHDRPYEYEQVVRVYEEAFR